MSKGTLISKGKLAVLLSFTMLTACIAPVGQQDSGIEAPGSWVHLGDNSPDALITTDINAQVEHDWWKHFNDPVLDALIVEALKNNKTLAIAKARVDEARANRNAARSTLMPQINGEADAQRENLGALTNQKSFSIADLEAQATWELDIFGQNQARTSQAAAIMQSTKAAHQGVLVGLLAELARNYFDMRNYIWQIAITEENLDTERKTLELTKNQFKGALASDFDVQRTIAQVATTEAELPLLKAGYEMTMNRINVLLGHPPGERNELLMQPAAMQPVDLKVIVAAPATVLATRPDVRVAERNFAASISGHSAAVRELFPSISLTALFGIQDSNVGHGTPWSAGATAILPVLNFGAIQSDIDAADARQQQAFLQYQETVLEALENMENALTNYLHENDRNASLIQAMNANKKANVLAHQRYNDGENSLLDVLIVERNALDAESSLATSDAMLRKDLVNIYTAAGGGWAAPDVPQSY